MFTEQLLCVGTLPSTWGDDSEQKNRHLPRPTEAPLAQLKMGMEELHNSSDNSGSAAKEDHTTKRTWWG